MRTWIILLSVITLPGIALAQAVHIPPAIHTEDTAHASGDGGYMCLAVRNDAGAALAGTTGDYIPLTTDNTGQLRVAAACTVGGVVEDVAESGGDTLAAAGAVVRAGKTGSTATAGDFATLNVTTTGGLWGASDQVEDAAEADAMPLKMMGAVVRATVVGSSATGGDNATLNVSTVGSLHVIDTGGSSLVCGTLNVTSAGTAEQLGSNACKEIIVSCPAANTSDCYIRGSTGNGITGGMPLAQDSSQRFRLNNTNLLWLDAGTTNDDVGWCCIN